jgi:hypothetical protein
VRGGRDKLAREAALGVVNATDIKLHSKLTAANLFVTVRVQLG